MQCKFSERELCDLDTSLMDTLIECKLALRRGQGSTEKLKETVERLDTLHTKLVDLIENYDK